MKNSLQKNIIISAIGTVFVLMIPFLAMRLHVRFPDPGDSLAEVAWTLGDFIFAGVLLFGSGLVYSFATRNMKDSNRRLIVGLVVFSVLAFIWVGAATGFERFLSN